MGRLKSWFSSKLSTEAGKCDQADRYAELADPALDDYRSEYYQASVEIPNFCYAQVSDERGFAVSKRQRTVEDADGRIVAIVDYDANDNVLGIEILCPTLISYDERRNK